MSTEKRFFIIFLVLFGILRGVCCFAGNHSAHSQLNKKSELEKARLLENPPEKKIIEKRRLLFNEDNTNPTINTEKEAENHEYSNRRRTNFSESENEKMPNWGNLRLQFPAPANSEISRDFSGVRLKQPFVGMQNLNQKYDWEKKSDVFQKTQSSWNEEKNFKQFENQNSRTGNNYNERFEGMINDGQMNREDRRDDVFDRRYSITTFKDADMGNMKNYQDSRIGTIHSGYMMNDYHKNPNSYWNPNFLRPEKGVVINLNTECSTPRQLNNQLVHKFVFTPKPSLNMHSGFSGFQIPESSLISSYKVSPMYYI